MATLNLKLVDIKNKTSEKSWKKAIDLKKQYVVISTGLDDEEEPFTQLLTGKEVLLEYWPPNADPIEDEEELGWFEIYEVVIEN